VSARTRQNVGTAFALVGVAVWVLVLAALLGLACVAGYHAVQEFSRGNY
jgi:hypothetical protein